MTVISKVVVLSSSSPLGGLGQFALTPEEVLMSALSLVNSFADFLASSMYHSETAITTTDRDLRGPGGVGGLCQSGSSFGHGVSIQAQGSLLLALPAVVFGFAW